MSFNPSWNKWIFASVLKHFKTILEGHSISTFIEGTSNRDLTQSEYVEIRMDGPYTNERSRNDFVLRVEVNLLIQVIVDPQKNLYRNMEVSGRCVESMTTIPVFKLGNDIADTGDKIGCLELEMPQPRDHVRVHNFGQVETDVKLQQSTVEGHYKIELEG